MTPNTVGAKAPKPKTATAQKRFVGIVSGKGGVGKTMTARALLDIYRAEEIKVAAFDADGAVGGLVRNYGKKYDDSNEALETQDPLDGVGFYDLRSENERNTLLDSASLDAAVILHDMPGGSTTDVQKVSDGGEGVSWLLNSLESVGARMTLLHVIDNEIESAQSVGAHLELYGNRVDHVAILNMRECKSLSDFPYWAGYEVNGSKMYGKARDRLLAGGGVEVMLPSLPPATRAKVNALRMPFSKVTDSTDFTLTERSHVERFLRGFSANLEPARKFLGL